MKLLTFHKNGKLTLGVKTNAGIIDVEDALNVFPENGVFTDIMDMIEGGKGSVRRLEQFVASLDKRGAGYVKQESDITFGPAITNPSKIICVGLNYKKHADETKLPYPKEPILFNKYNNALTGHLNEVTIPRTTERLDFEVELGIVIGKTGKNIEPKDALDYVFGYCTTNDLSARDTQKKSSQWMLGKTSDGFAPVGPYLVTKDEIDNPNALQLKTTYNGEVRQNSNTADMVFSCEEIISYISTYMTLEPGDLIMTGTPEGVIIGRPIEERDYIEPGDTVTVEVEKLGALTNTFVADEE